MFLFVNLDGQAEFREDPFSDTKYSQRVTNVIVENWRTSKEASRPTEIKCHYFLQLSQLLYLNEHFLQLMIWKTVSLNPSQFWVFVLIIRSLSSGDTGDYAGKNSLSFTFISFRGWVVQMRKQGFDSRGLEVLRWGTEHKPSLFIYLLEGQMVLWQACDQTSNARLEFAVWTTKKKKKKEL